MSATYWDGATTASRRAQDAFQRLSDAGFKFDEDFQFAFRYAAEKFNAATLWKVFGLAQVLEREHPITVRGGMYRGIPQLFRDSADSNYRCCVNLILKMRRLGILPFSYIADNTRNRRKPSSWSGLADFADVVAQAYRRDLWERQPHYIEFFVEKDAMAGVLEPITQEYDIHLLPIRGDCSETLVQQIGEEWRQIEKPIYAYYFGDHDLKGFPIEQSFRKRVEGYAERTVNWTRLGVTQADFDNPEILGLELKKNPKARALWQPYQERYGDRCIEIDAIAASEIRARARAAIESHIDRHARETLQVIEAEEKKNVFSAIRTFGGTKAA